MNTSTSDGKQQGIQNSKYVPLHERDAGAACLKCGPEGCEGGLDLHFWRKICKTCKCKPQDHDIKSSEEEAHRMVVGSLFNRDSTISHVRDYFDKLDRADKQVKTEYVKKFSWVPPGLNQATLVKYMDSLPPERRPMVGSEGAKYRRQQMVYQLPIHDHDENYCDNLTDAEREKMREFCKMRNDKSLGVGDIREKTVGTPKWECHRCGKGMANGEIAVFASRAGEEKCWHPGCFVCCMCNNLLVDLIYFYKEGNIYCGRHYAEQFKPRCAACDELIFSEQYTQAEDRNWHQRHFCCLECDKDLGGMLYVAKNGQPHCLECYDKFYAKSCNTCRKKIAADGQRIEHDGVFWHADEACFNCAYCRRNLLGQQFLKARDNVFCSVDCAKSHMNLP
ncbi:testin-like isoform X2 [Actinia tenebrosa]|uniref:Testin-like isoform X2 n=1 Tax=Actinia tenebrosa TaxID=6105 RepID=A0A6P8IH10_ACTTE|nr:testin-like isoform X2 [Actinia tenebrosa]